MNITIGDRTFRPSQLEKLVAYLAEEMDLLVEICACVPFISKKDHRPAEYMAELTATGMYCNRVWSGSGPSMFSALAEAFAAWNMQQ